MGMERVRTITGTCLVLVATVLSAYGAPPPRRPLFHRTPAPPVLFDQAYHNGELVKFESAPVTKGSKLLLVGPWNLGPKLAAPKPHDGRPNLYFVFPGTQHQLPDASAYDHNEIVNVIPVKNDPVEWDVYWVVVLDPTLQKDFRDEKDVIMEEQVTFSPHDATFEQLPSHEFLEKQLKIKTMEQVIERFQREDGTLPRLAIVPANVAVKATATETDQEQAASK